MPRKSTAWSQARRRIEEAFADRRCYAPRNYSETRLLRRRVYSSEVIEPFPNLFCNADAWQMLRRDEQERYVIRAYARAHPGTVFRSISAAVIHRLPVSFSQLGCLHICTSEAAPSSATLRVARHRGSTDGAVEIDGVLVVPVMRAAIETMCESSFCDGLAVADGLLRKEPVDRDLLASAVEHFARGRRGAAMARLVATYADGRAESGGESIARGVMIQKRIVPTDLQRIYYDPVDSRQWYRVDFVFELLSGDVILGEFDGKAKYEDRALLGGRTGVEAMLDERQRESHLTLLGMPVLRFTWQDVTKPERLVCLLETAGVTAETLVGHDYRVAASGLS